MTRYSLTRVLGGYSNRTGLAPQQTGLPVEFSIKRGSHPLLGGAIQGAGNVIVGTVSLTGGDE